MRWLFPAAFVAIVVVAGWNVQLYRRTLSAEEEGDRLEEVREELDGLARAWRDLDRPGNDVLETYDVALQQTNLERYEAAMQDAWKQLSAADGTAAGEELHKRLHPLEVRVGSLTREILKAAAEREKLRLANADDVAIRAQELIATVRMTELDGAFQDGMDLVFERLGALGTVAAAQREEQREQLVRLFGMLLVTLCGAGASVELLRRERRTAGRLAELRGTIERVVAERDFRLSPGDSGADDVGRLATALRSLLESVRALHAGLRAAVGEAAANARSLSAVAEQQGEAVRRQAAALEEIHVTAQEIRQTSALAAQKAKAVFDAADRAEGAAHAGAASVSAGRGGIAEVRAHTAALAQQMSSARDATRQVAKVTEAVKSLADQSNMLALNAAIEAVRSGAQGSGFAVVAREIRSLADQSIQSTHEVKRLLDGAQTAIAAAAELAERGEKGIAGSLAQVENTGTQLATLAEQVRESSAAARQIASAVSQQDAGIGQIFEGMRETTTLVRENEEGLDALTRSVRALDETARRAEQLVDAYRA